MQSSVGIGRIGSLNIFLHYTWLLVFILGLWWLALLWLPDTYPRWPGWAYWLVALAVLILYFVSTIVHELIHSAVARTGPRTVILYPFGAATPFRMSQVAPGRAVFAALAAPLFNLVLGGVMLLVGLTVGVPGSALAVPGAILAGLGWLNLALGAFNLIPGVPFDGGWALAAGAYWFSGDRESGLATARTVGEVAALVLVLLGAWRGLTTNSWLEALALVLVGWMARDAAALSRQRASLRGVLDSVTASDIMDTSRSGDAVAADATVADLVRSHPRQAPEEPIAVTDGAGALVGFSSLGAAETVLQGNWAATPVRAITTPVSEAEVINADDSVTDVMAIAGGRGGATELAFPVVDNGRLVGSVNVNRLQSFATAGQQFGMEETVAAPKRGAGGLLGALLPAAIVIAAMAVLGNLALRTNPAEIRDLTNETADAPLVFANYNPAEDAIVGADLAIISVDVSGPSAITTATLTLDGQPIEATMTGESPLTQTVSAQVPGLTQGPHTVAVEAGTETGRTKTATWQFRVTFRQGQGGEGDQPSAAPPVRFTGYTPSLGQRLLAGASGSQIVVDVRADDAPTDARVLLDDQPLDTKVEPTGDGQYRITAAAPEIAAGTHRARAEVVGAGGGFYSTEWTFSGLVPDESNVYFAETGQFLSEPFLSYWRANGDVRIFGFPISDRIQEKVEATGEVYTAQYFERARLEQHAAAPSTVVLGRLGAMFHEPEPPASPIDGAQFFPETGHNLQGPFLAFWQQYGGLAVFGFPISEELTETNPVDGKQYTVQYFERNRFELHPEFAGTPNEVQLGLLGTRLFDETYGK
jgi:Zn-dependent protease